MNSGVSRFQINPTIVYSGWYSLPKDWGVGSSKTRPPYDFERVTIYDLWKRIGKGGYIWMADSTKVKEYMFTSDTVEKDPSNASINYILIKEWDYKIEKTGTKEAPSNEIRGTVYSDKRNAYPDNGKLGKYWYVYSDIK